MASRIESSIASGRVMQNRFPLWKNLLILFLLLLGVFYALPNFYGEDPALQIAPQRGAQLNQTRLQEIERRLRAKGLIPKEIEFEEGKLLIRFTKPAEQLKAQEVLRSLLGGDYTIALMLAPNTPNWLEAIGAKPMYLGLDLRGGVHFLLQIDMETALDQALDRYLSDLRAALRSSRIRYLTLKREGETILIKVKTPVDYEKAVQLVKKEFHQFAVRGDEVSLQLRLQLTDAAKREIREFALKQNLITLRNRVNELGVAEPIIQRQGEDRVVVELPGVQDPALAKEVLGATATVEFRLVDVEHDVEEALRGRVPIGAKLYYTRDGKPYLLKREVIVTGDQIIDATAGFDQQSGTPAVFVTLDSSGARRMLKVTRENVGKPMAVVFIETRIETRKTEGQMTKFRKRIEEIINVATIRGVFGKRFQITGLDSIEEARKLALLLRAGALAAPMEIVEERTVGPSLGQENIERGFQSVVVGLVLVVLFMAFYYRIFGIVADIALIFNLILLIAILSLLQATLTLPGIAGIVLTVGMAVDANVLIFERIKEELRQGSSAQLAIYLGYERAFATILDANVTTLIAALVLFGFGTGPIKGFAVTLSIGILTSMFTAILVTRMIVNWLYGGRRTVQLAI